MSARLLARQVLRCRTYRHSWTRTIASQSPSDQLRAHMAKNAAPSLNDPETSLLRELRNHELEDVEQDEDGGRNSEFQNPELMYRPPPDSPAFYTGRPEYYERIVFLEKATNMAKAALKARGLYPLPPFALERIPKETPYWLPIGRMGDVVSAKLTTTRYRRLTKLLSELFYFRTIARTSGSDVLLEAIDDVLQAFEIPQEEIQIKFKQNRKEVPKDEYGRTLTRGRRKTSSARVWMIPTNIPKSVGTSAIVNPPPPVTATSILINNMPLAEFFQISADRDRIVRPLKLTGTLGAYNIFAICRGGGLSGQSGAISQGIAKGLAAHEPELTLMLRRAKLLRRDPRMVERKKTGLAKARKRYQWVKR